MDPVWPSAHFHTAVTPMLAALRLYQVRLGMGWAFFIVVLVVLKCHQWVHERRNYGEAKRELRVRNEWPGQA
jgi:hypothetical protein